MKLTDLDLDCLEEVLALLDLEDIVNAADSCIRMNKAAKLVFTQKYGMYSKLACVPFKPNENAKYKLCDIQNSITILNYKFGLQVLRCFGHTFNHIFYENEMKNDEISHYAEYINEFCTETLKSITIYHCDFGNILNEFTRPFKRVEMIVSYECRTDLLPNDFFLRFFPKIQKLILTTDCPQLSNSGWMANHIPNLKFLSINIRKKCALGTAQCNCLKNILSILRLNPQLTTLYLDQFRKCDVHILQTLNEYNKAIESLWINFNHSDFNQKISNGSVFHLNHVKHLRLHIKYPHIHKIPFSFDQLDKLSVCIMDRVTQNPFTDHFYNFCKKNPSLKKLELRIECCPRLECREYQPLIDNYSTIIKYVPLLEELTVQSIYQIDDLIEMINLFEKHEPLRTIKFRLYKQPISCLRQRLILTNGWSIFSTEKTMRNAAKFVSIKR